MPIKRDFNRWEILFVCAVFAAGLALRLRLAALTWLNPDEALHAIEAFGTWGETIRNSIRDTHPPLHMLMSHMVSLISRSELSLRLAPVLAGSLFPLLIFVWLRRVAGRLAAATALFLLTLAPHLISISAQVRSYTIAFLFLSASLVALEEALDGDRWIMMAAYSVLLWLCILSDYSMAWFAGAAGIYALLRLRGSSVRVKVTWMAGQLAALSLYGLLFVIQVRAATAFESRKAVTGWLVGAFPQRGMTILFPFVGTLKQFAYLMASVPIGGLATVLFAVAVYWLWSGRTSMEINKARALAILLVVPFVLAIAGAYAHQFPYGRTRHSLVIGLFGAIGIAIFIETLPRRPAIAVLGGMLLLTPLWLWKGDEDQADISSDRNRKELILQCLDYMRAAIPPGTVILIEGDTLLVLDYYDGHNTLTYRPDLSEFVENPLGGRWRAATKDYQYSTPDEYRAGLAAFRRQYGIGEHQPVWVLDGGWSVRDPPDERRPFTRALQVFQAGAP